MESCRFFELVYALFVRLVVTNRRNRLIQFFIQFFGAKKKTRKKLSMDFPINKVKRIPQQREKITLISSLRDGLESRLFIPFQGYQGFRAFRQVFRHFQRSKIKRYLPCCDFGLFIRDFHRSTALTGRRRWHEVLHYPGIIRSSGHELVIP